MIRRTLLRIPRSNITLRRFYASDSADGSSKVNRFAQKYANEKPQQRPRTNQPRNNNTPTQNVIRRNPNNQSPAASLNTGTPRAQPARHPRTNNQNQSGPISPPKPVKKPQVKKARKPVKKLVKIQLPPFITVSNLATIIQAPLNDVFKKLEGLGFEDIRHNFILDKENAAMIADEYGLEVEESDSSTEDLFPAPAKPELLQERPPVVTIMGHVDHGKTTILDYLRKSSIVSHEFGGITQHIGAFSVITPQSKKKITFLDTPGHAAFLKMRERGAIITDIVILVVAADDSVMPQTKEAIKHAKKSGVPMIVAINKCDKPGVKIDKVLGDLAANEIDIEDYGGDTQTVQVSGKTGLNMDKLEEAVITLSELNDFKAEPKGIPAEGWVIESEVVKGMGNIATVLVRRGSLKTGDVIVAGDTYCKIRGMKDENNKPVKIAGPSTPVRIWGWKELPDSGDQMLQAKTEQIAKKVIDYRVARAQQIQATRDIEDINVKRLEEIKEAERMDKIAEMKKAGLDTSALEKAEEESKITKCCYIIKSDVFGSAEAIKESIDGLGNEEVTSVVISHEAGPPSDSDIEMAKTFNATIFSFNMKVPKQISMRADKEGVRIKEHNIIYRLIEDVTEELSSHLKPRVEIKTVGEVEIRDVFVVTVKKKKVKIAGCKVTQGSIKSNSDVVVLRNEKEIFKGKLSSLKHVKDDITEATKGKDCGIAFENWDGFEAGDEIKVQEEILHKRYL
ncbi:IFM1 Translation initiation factor IF-2 [Candida maltosa Xu316]|uniref:Translation initiation factor IF-2, mitochondrial n=1 Tax=Candida maltosa (strain Xu316) TaxID=1245528 RepID=M3IMR0_CANMX|nr:Translation initiation factor IF-2 [Candida maltosa Xu316]